MKPALLALAILGLSTGAALAAPGDARVIEGTLEWPATVSNEPFVIVQTDDGFVYYADIGAAQRRTSAQLTAGSRVALLGVEGARPWEMVGIAIGSGSAAALGLTPGEASPSSPSASIPSTAPGPPAEQMWRLDGIVRAVAGRSVTVRTRDGRTQAVDLSQVSPNTLKALRPGDRVSFFGVQREDHRLVANGYIQSGPDSPPAAPRGSTR